MSEPAINLPARPYVYNDDELPRLIDHENNAPRPYSGGMQATWSGKWLAVSSFGVSRDLVQATANPALS